MINSKFGNPKNENEQKLEQQIMLPPKPNGLEIVNNRLYFYEDIYRDSILNFNKALLDLDVKLFTEYIINESDTPNKIFIHLNSYGGSIFDGLAAHDQLALCKCPTITIIDGIVASAASFISLRGTHRLMKKNSVMLIHQLSSAFWGKYSDMEDEKKNMDMLMEMIRNIYNTYSKIPKKELDSILKHDLYFDAKKCLKYGLVDGIL